MLETFLILLGGGVMLSVAVSDPGEVTLNWLRLAGILALVFAGVALFGAGRELPLARYTIAGTGILVCGQLGFAQAARRGAQRGLAALAFVLAVTAGTISLRWIPESVATRHGWVWPALSCVGAAAMCGLALMDMLLGHAYLTAAKMTIAPFRRLNLALAVAVIARVITSLVVAHFVNEWRPVPRLWGAYGLLIGTRWAVGLLVPAIFVYMAHDCIRRRSTQSATGILYVAGVLIFIGEIIALQLVRDTGLPF
jgi:hypothetical protein